MFFFVPNYLPAFLKITIFCFFFFFSKKGAKIGFFKFLCFKFTFLNFFGLPKHYKNRGFSKFLVFFVVEREEKNQKIMITEISGFGFFLSNKWPFRDA